MSELFINQKRGVEITGQILQGNERGKTKLSAFFATIPISLRGNLINQDRNLADASSGYSRRPFNTTEAQ